MACLVIFFLEERFKRSWVFKKSIFSGRYLERMVSIRQSAKGRAEVPFRKSQNQQNLFRCLIDTRLYWTTYEQKCARFFFFNWNNSCFSSTWKLREFLFRDVIYSVECTFLPRCNWIFTYNPHKFETRALLSLVNSCIKSEVLQICYAITFSKVSKVSSKTLLLCDYKVHT